MIAEIAHALGEAHKEGKRIVEFRCSPEGAYRLRVSLMSDPEAAFEENESVRDALADSPADFIGEVMGMPVWLNTQPDAPDLSVVTEVRPLTKEQVAAALALIDTLTTQPTAHGPNPKDNTHG